MRWCRPPPPGLHTGRNVVELEGQLGLVRHRELHRLGHRSQGVLGHGGSPTLVRTAKAPGAYSQRSTLSSPLPSAGHSGTVPKVVVENHAGAPATSVGTGSAAASQGYWGFRRSHGSPRSKSTPYTTSCAGWAAAGSHARPSLDVVGDLCGFADSLAGFLVALRHVDPSGGPEPGLHNWFRGGPLEVLDPQTRRGIEVLDGRVPRDTVTEIWASALDAAWDGRPAWFHGDVAPGNLLVRDGALAAVIDFGTCGVGDPACDVAIAWMFFSGASREAYRARLDIDPGTWARGRGWALWKALVVYAGALHGDRAAVAWARRIIDEVLTEFAEPA